METGKGRSGNSQGDTGTWTSVEKWKLAQGEEAEVVFSLVRRREEVEVPFSLVGSWLTYGIPNQPWSLQYPKSWICWSQKS